MNAGSNINERGCCEAKTETCSGKQWKDRQTSCNVTRRKLKVRRKCNEIKKNYRNAVHTGKFWCVCDV